MCEREKKKKKEKGVCMCEAECVEYEGVGGMAIEQDSRINHSMQLCLQ